MKRTLLFAFVTFLTTVPLRAQAPIDPGNPIVAEPILVYDWSQVTGAQALHTNLVVYNDGSAVKAIWLKRPGRRAVTYVSSPRRFGSRRLDRLVRKLLEAGADKLGDQVPRGLGPLPNQLGTVTFFARPGPDAAANTFSYIRPQGPYEAVHAVIWREMHQLNRSR